MKNKELIIKDIQSNECQGKTTQKLTRNKKRLKKITAPQKENADDIIKETDSTI